MAASRTSDPAVNAARAAVRARKTEARRVKIRRVACTDCPAQAGSKCVDTNGLPRDTNHAGRTKAHAAAFPAVQSMHAQGGAARDRYGREHQAGSGPAAYGGVCPRCDQQFNARSDMVKGPRDVWIHRACASGADDE